MAPIPATHENLEGPLATAPLTEWLVDAAKRRDTVTYGRAKVRLERDCGFDTVFTVAVGRVGGAAMDRILEHRTRAPLLNVLLVATKTGLPGKGAVGYLANRYPDVGWLRKEGAHEDRRWAELVDAEAQRVYAYTRWEELYREIYKVRLVVRDDAGKGTGRNGTGRNGAVAAKGRIIGRCD